MNALLKNSIGWVSTAVLCAFVGFGAYSYYFKKPIHIVNNTTVQPGANLNVEQARQSSGGFGIIAGPLFIDGKFGAFAGVQIKF